MKTRFTLFTLIAGFLATGLLAADFTGTVAWKTRVEITDPEMKKQMADAQAQMADPEMQAQMKAAQEAMNDPQMQAMLKANPQMREMMEKQMKAFSKPGAATGGDMFPKGFTLRVKGPRSLLRTEGGMAAGDVLTLADKNVSYQIDRDARTYRQISAEAAKTTEAKETPFKVTQTKETASVLGYTCTKYLVESTDRDVPMAWSIWATEDIKGLDASSLRRMRMGQSAGPDFFSKINGVPLKIDATMPQMKMFMEATSVKAESLPDSLFALPAGFKEVSGY